MELAKLRDKYEVIGDVRGKGLLIGVEMVKDKVLEVKLTVDETRLLPRVCVTCYVYTVSPEASIPVNYCVQHLQSPVIENRTQQRYI